MVKTFPKSEETESVRRKLRPAEEKSDILQDESRTAGQSGCVSLTRRNQTCGTKTWLGLKVLNLSQFHSCFRLSRPTSADTHADSCRSPSGTCRCPHRGPRRSCCLLGRNNFFGRCSCGGRATQSDLNINETSKNKICGLNMECMSLNISATLLLCIPQPVCRTYLNARFDLHVMVSRRP